VFGGQHQPACLDRLQPERVGQCGGRPLAVPGEHPAALQRGHAVHHGPLNGPFQRDLPLQRNYEFRILDVDSPGDMQRD
jgi:hypothetical protein